MKMSKYVVRNKVNGIADRIFLARTDAEFARQVTADISRVPAESRTFDLNDFEILRIGTFDTETLDEVILENREFVPFDTRYLSEHCATADVKEVQNDIAGVR